MKGLCLPLAILTSLATTHGLLQPLASATQHDWQTLISLSQAAPPFVSSSLTTASSASPLNWYMSTLTAHPLPTKMMTGFVVALTGDWIAQSREEEPYDKRRAASFGLFDSFYRASQHFLYPLVVQSCQGQLFLKVAPQDIAAAMEQTLVSQLVIVPLLYYPVFYGVTSFVQGLTAEQAVERAKQTFVPLMKRNLMFWIPVQFVQFEFVPEELQIPFLSVCGLCWTLILSVMAGSAKDYSNDDNNNDPLEEADCVTGMENKFLVPQEELFPHTNLDDISHEMQDIAQEVGQTVFGDTDDDDDDTGGAAKNRETQKEKELVLRK